ncbi:uncharacterized protein IUM83_19771 [Phytophthora cinnamomi]|uniref:uncharacterized protein n=1 Tax=Phytophthora cinnamomi TaxID=4785 RepID=UPI00355A394A|nr:hypothetical protein IUM83_19771 [Phytophthora cinnamomi]
MQLAQFLLLLTVALLAGSVSADELCGDSSVETPASTTSAPVVFQHMAAKPQGKQRAVGTKSKDLVGFMVPIKLLALLQADDGEERGGANTGAAARAIGSNAVPLNGPVANPGTDWVVITKYNNNGLFQRIARWWKSFGIFLLGGKRRRLRGVHDA